MNEFVVDSATCSANWAAEASLPALQGLTQLLGVQTYLRLGGFCSPRLWFNTTVNAIWVHKTYLTEMMHLLTHRSYFIIYILVMYLLKRRMNTQGYSLCLALHPWDAHHIPPSAPGRLGWPAFI